MSRDLTVVGLGEALWDLLPAGKKLGGAPLNVAVHVERLLRGRDGRGIVASRIGKDALGDEIVGEFQRRGMTSEHLQRDDEHPTSTVRVELRDGQPAYAFADNVAWDYLEYTEEWAELATNAAAVCFGTLAQRSRTSRETIWKFLDASRAAIRLFDVNLRPPFYDRESLTEGCRRATLVKLSEEELVAVANLTGIPGGSPVYRLAQLRARFDLGAVIFTRGRRGTMLVLDNKVIQPPEVSYLAAENADSVGAGDACSAGIITGWLLGLPPIKTAELANHLGAFVASQPGATPELPAEIIKMTG
jgi:fructokinase